MCEKIAEALVRHYLDGGPWDGFIEADLVLDALMKPTEGMLQYEIDQKDLREGEKSDGELIFQAMIRAAKEGR